MIKTILVPVTGFPSDTVALETAYLSARLFDAQIDALHVRPDWAQVATRAISPDAVGGMRADEYFEAFQKEVKSLAWRAHRHTAEFCSKRALPLDKETGSGVSVHWHEREGDAVDVVTRQARFHDVTVFGRAPEGNDLAPARLGPILLGAGRPLIVAPEKAPENLAPTVALAWKETREAAHAVTAAMPFLLKAEKVVVLAVNESDEPGKAADSAEHLARELRRNGISAQSQSVPLAEGVGNSLVRAAISSGADLLIMGGYGHSRVREFILGGATRGILHACPIPVLLCH